MMRDFVKYVEKELTHSSPKSEVQIDLHKRVSDLFVKFGVALAEVVPDSPDATKMVNYLTISRAWAQKAVAQHFEIEEDDPF